MSIALEIMSIIALSIFIVLLIWGFILFFRYTEDMRKQNMMLFSILEKLGNAKQKENNQQH